MIRNLGILFLALAVTTGCRSITSPTLEADPAAVRLAVPDAPPASTPTGAPELRNVRVTAHGDRFVLHAQLDLNGWQLSDLGSPDRGECPETGELGCETEEAWIVTNGIHVPGRGVWGIPFDQFRFTRNTVRAEWEFPGLRDLARSDGVEDQITYRVGFTAFHESWPEQDYRISDFRGLVQFLGGPPIADWGGGVQTAGL